MFKLNWGCAFDLKSNWYNSDKDDHGQDHIGDILDGLPWVDNFFDAVVANHSLQMIRYVDLPAVFNEFHRVMKPGGVIRILVPDALAAVRAYERNDAAWFPIGNETEPNIGGKLSAYLVWYSEANLVFTSSWLAELLQRNNFDAAVAAPGVTIFGSHVSDIVDLDSRPNESIIVEGRKRS